MTNINLSSGKIRRISRDDDADSGLLCSSCLHSVFKIRLARMQRIKNHRLIHSGNLDKLQQVFDQRQRKSFSLCFCSDIKQISDRGRGQIELNRAAFGRFKHQLRRLGKWLPVKNEIQDNIGVQQDIH